MRILDALDLFEVQLDADGRSIHTKLQYRRHVRLFAAWLEQRGSADLDEVDVHVVARFLASDTARLRADGAPRAWASINAVKASVKGFLAYCGAAGLAPRNAGALISPSPGSRPEPRPIRPAELTKLLASLRADPSPAAQRDLVLLELLAATGIRLGGALGLNVRDVDLDACELRVRLKGGRVQRVTLPDDVSRVLATHVAGKTGPVFARATGRSLSARHVQRRFRSWCRRAGVAGAVTVHSLRHRYALELYDKTHDLLAVRDALGHRSLGATLAYARRHGTSERCLLIGE